MDVRNHHAGWSDVTAQVVGHEVANRTFAGIAASITNDTRHFWIGLVVIRAYLSRPHSVSVLLTFDALQRLNRLNNICYHPEQYYAEHEPNA